MLDITVVDRTLTIAICGKTLDRPQGELLLQEIKASVDQNNQIICDLTNLGSLDSSGLGVLLGCLREVNAAGGDLKLCCLSPLVRSVFLLTHMHRLFQVYNTREEALRAFSVNSK